MIWSIIGMSAATLTMFSFVPQIVKIKRTKSSKDVSRGTLLQLSAGVFLWIIYGIARHDLIIIVANVITLSSLIILLYFSYLYGGQKE